MKLTALAISVIAVMSAAPNALAAEPMLGIGPSHIVGSADRFFTSDLEAWDETREAIDFFKFNWKQLAPERHTDQPQYTWARLSSAPFVQVMQENDIRIGSEFNQLHYAVLEEDIAEAAAELVIKGHQPLTDAGGELYSLHMDGFFRILVGGIFTGVQEGYEPVSLEEACGIFEDFAAAIHRAWPDCKVGLIVNLPNWRYSPELDYIDGSDWSSKMGGLYYRDVLDALAETLDDVGDSLGFIEVDYPHTYFMKHPEQNARKFREIQAWCNENGVDFHFIVNDPPETAQDFQEGVLNYLPRLLEAGIAPDLFLIQSWYREPAHFAPESEPYTLTNTALKAARLLDEDQAQ